MSHNIAANLPYPDWSWHDWQDKKPTWCAILTWFIRLASDNIVHPLFVQHALDAADKGVVLSVANLTGR